MVIQSSFEKNLISNENPEVLKFAKFSIDTNMFGWNFQVKYERSHTDFKKSKGVVLKVVDDEYTGFKSIYTLFSFRKYFTITQIDPSTAKLKASR